MEREKRIVLGLAVVAALAIGFTTVDRAVFHQTPKTDLTVYIRAAQAVLDGSDIYKVQNARGWNYVYLPLFAIAMIPLAKLPLIASVLLWYLLSVALLSSAIWMSAAMTGAREFALRWIPALLLFMPLATGLVRGQASILMLWLVVAATYFDWKGRQITGAICLAGAILLKVFPAALLGYFIWKKRWRFVLWTLIATCFGMFLLPSVVFGWRKNVTFVNEWTLIVAKPALDFDRAGSPVFEQLLDPQKLRNQSLEAVLIRLMGNPLGKWLGVALGAVMTLVTGSAIRRSQSAAVQVSAAICWILLIPPVSEDHYFALLLLPVTVLVGFAVRGCGEARWALSVFAAATIAYAASDRARFSGTLCWATALLWLALVVASFRNNKIRQRQFFTPRSNSRSCTPMSVRLEALDDRRLSSRILPMRRITPLLAVFLVAISFTLSADGTENVRPLTRILFGSCNKSWREQPLWKPILANRPDLWIWLGDIIYADTENMAEMKQKYDAQKARPDYQQLIAACPIVGVWDDNDYGQNDGGKNYPMKRESQKLLLDFLDEPSGSARRKQDGVQTATTFGPPGKEIKIILLDGRSHRDDPGPNADPLGEEQWRWLEQQLTKSAAQIHLIGSGSQVIACEHPFEKWADYPKARQRLLDLIARTRPRGAILLSGDRHLGEISRLDDSKIGYPLYDVTSSGLTHHAGSGWRNFFYDFKKELNRYRVGENFLGCNFGMIEIDWSVSPPRVKLQIRDQENKVRSEAVVGL